MRGIAMSGKYLDAFMFCRWSIDEQLSVLKRR